MKLSTVWAMTDAAIGAAVQIAERDSALAGTGGFEKAWVRTRDVPGWFGEAESSAFWAVIHERRPRTVVEIGSYQGRSTTLLGLALKSAGVREPTLIAIDPHTGDRQHLDRVGVDVLPSLDMFTVHVRSNHLDDIVDMRVATSEAAAVGWTQPIDLLFVDGWHSYDAVMADGRNYCRHLTADGLVCFDDYGNYREVREAVDAVCAELGLTLYGTVIDQAWAGRAGQPPASIARVLRLDRRRRALSRSLRRRGQIY